MGRIKMSQNGRMVKKNYQPSAVGGWTPRLVYHLEGWLGWKRQKVSSPPPTQGVHQPLSKALMGEGGSIVYPNLLNWMELYVSKIRPAHQQHQR